MTLDSVHAERHASIPGAPPQRRSRWALEALLVLAVMVAGLVPDPSIGTSPAADSIAGTTFRIVTIGVIAVALPLRRRWPLQLAVLVGVTTVLAPLWTTSTNVYLLALSIVLYRVATDLRPRTAFIAGGVLAAALICVAAVRGETGDHYARLVQPPSVIGVALAAGQATRNRRAYLAAVTERAERAERTRELEASRRVAEERLRIARELHDAAAHQIAAINLHAGVASNALPDRPDDAERALAVIRDAAHGVLSEISTLLRILRDEPEGQRVEPVATLDALDALVEDFGRSGLEVSVIVRGRRDDIGGAAGVVAYRTVQEGLANALKHGGAGRAAVRIDVGADVAVIRVTNPMPGDRTASAPASGRHGLLGVRERVDAMQGRMRSGEDAGEYVLQVELPIPAGATA